MKRKNIPQRMRECVWRRYISTLDGKCTTERCDNIISPFNFEVAHNIAWSIGGKDVLDNFRPLCSTCNRGMSNEWTCDGWNECFGSDISMCEFRSTNEYSDMSIYIHYEYGKTTVNDLHNEYLKIYDPKREDPLNPYIFNVYYDNVVLSQYSLLPDPDDPKLVVDWS